MHTPRHPLSPAAACLAIVFALAASAAQAAYPCNGPGPGERLVGMAPGGNGVASTPLCEAVDGAPYEPPLSVPAPPSVRWADRWGAIVLGGGGFGAASGQTTEREARELAKAQCLQSNLGKGCDEVAAYYNQCVAAAAGSNDFTIASLSPDPAYAKQLALASCGKEAQGCEVFYSACSDRVRLGN